MTKQVLILASTRLRAVGAMALLMTALAFAGGGSPPVYDAAWFTVESGGGVVMTGGGFEITGSAGQHDSGESMFAGNIEITGGFRAAPTGENIWGGGVSSSFFTASFWSDGCVPAGDETVILNKPGVAYTIKFDTADAETSRLEVHKNDVTFQFHDRDYTLIGGSLPGSASLVIARDNEVASLRLKNIGSQLHGLHALDASIGDGVNSEGTLRVEDPNTLFANDGTFWIGRRGLGTFRVLNGATATTDGSVVLGVESSGNGRAVLNGSTSSWTVNGQDVTVGENGDASLKITNGAQLVTNTSGELTFAKYGSSQAVVHIGAGSSWVENKAQQAFLGVGGTVNFTENGTLDIPEVQINDGSTLTGNGVINGDLVNYGSLEPGVYPEIGSDGPVRVGTLTINGDYRQIEIAAGNLARSGETHIRFDSAGGADRLVVNGVAELGGGLFIELLDESPAHIPPLSIIQSNTVFDTKFDVAFMPALSGNRFMNVNYPDEGVAGAGDISVSTADLAALMGFDSEDFPLGAGATAVAVGDFDGVNGDDLAITLSAGESTAGSVLVLLNNGTAGGVWQGFGGPAQVPVGNDPSAVTVGQFNNDASVDLAVANAGSDSVTVLPNNGSGAFGILPSVTINLGPSGDQPSAIAAANFDASAQTPGTIDLVVANFGSNNVMLLSNQGNASFAFPILFPAAIEEPISVDPADVDNDRGVGGGGGIDLVVLNQGSSTVSVFKNIGPPNYFAAPVVFDVGEHPVGLEVADLNNDGLDEIMTANAPPESGDGTVSVLVNGSGKDVSFAPAVNLQMTGVPRSLVAVNLDGVDGGDVDADVALLLDQNGEPVLQVLRNDTESEAGSPVVLAPADQAIDVADGAVAVVAGNLDGSGGDDDLIAVSDPSGGQSQSSGGGVAGGASPENLLLVLNETTTCPADIAPLANGGDGAVNVDDLLLIINTWGPCPGCPADITPLPNGDDAVNVDDLLAVINSWGACP